MAEITIETKLTGDATDLINAFQKGTRAGDDFDRGIRNSADGAATGMSKSSNSILGSLKAIGAGVALYFVGREIVSWAKDSIAALANWEAIQAQTNSVIESTGGVANVTADHIHDLAQSIEAATATQAESIQQGANLLLTFKNITNAAGDGNDIFDQTTSVMVDMARAMGTDAAGSAIMLGKALNDPVQGLSALRRVGVQFTDDQEALIKSMVEAGDVMGAQKIILAELNSEFGGSGAAFADTYAGKIYLMKDAFGDLGESMMTGLMPLLGELAVIATKAFNWLGQQPGITTFGQTLVDAFGTAWKVIQPFISMMSEKLGPVFEDLAPQVLSLVMALSPMGLVLQAILPVLPSIVDMLGLLGTVLSGALAAALPVVTQIIGELAGVLSGVLATALPVVVTLIRALAAVFDAIMPIVLEVAGVLADVLVDALDAILPVIIALLPMFTQLLTSLMPLIDPIMSIVEAFLPLISVLGELIATVLPVAIELLTTILGPILELIQPLMGLLVPALQLVAVVLGFVANLLAGFIGWLIDSNKEAEKMGGGVKGTFEQVGAVIGAVMGAIGFVIDTVVAGVVREFDQIVGAVNFLGGVFSSVFGAIGGMVSGVFSGVVTVIRGAINGIIALVNGAIGALNGIHVDIPAWMPLIGGQSFGVNLPTIPMLASGGTIMAPGLTWVGEKGPELVSLPRGATVIPTSYSLDIAKNGGGDSGGSGGGGNTYNIGGIHIDGREVDDDDQAERIMSEFRFATGG